MNTSYARAAYALGYAEHTDTVTPESADFCEFLMEIAPEFGPELLEVAQQMGSQHAQWSKNNTRRDALLTKWNLAMKPLLVQLARKVAGPIAKKFTPHESDQTTVLQLLKQNLSADEWQKYMTDAWMEAKAEGMTQAMAALAVAQNMPSPSMDLEFPQMLDALKNLGGDFSATADSWVQKQMDGMAYFVANDVSDALSSGKDYNDLLGIVSDSITDGDSANLLLDHMLSTGVSQGSIDQYQSENVDQVDVLTSPGACEECIELEDENPIDISEAEGELPLHYACRCAWAPHV